MSEVTVRGGLGLGQEVLVRGHSLTVDEPIESGGSDVGPTPYELLLAGLGACTAMTVRLYATRKGWPLHGVEVHVSHQRVHARDCVDCEKRPTWLDSIALELVLQGPLSEEQRQRLADIANHCPVHVTLEGNVRIEQTLLPSEIDRPSMST